MAAEMLQKSMFLLNVLYLCYMFYYIFIIYLYVHYMFFKFCYIFLFLYYLILNLCGNVFII